MGQCRAHSARFACLHFGRQGYTRTLRLHAERPGVGRDIRRDTGRPAGRRTAPPLPLHWHTASGVAAQELWAGWQPAGADLKSPGIRHSTCHRPHTPGCCTAQQVAITHMPRGELHGPESEGRGQSFKRRGTPVRTSQPLLGDQPGARAVRGHMPSLLERDIRPCSAFFGLFLAPRVSSLRGEQAGRSEAMAAAAVGA